ncbi:MAG: hypothetical protein EBV03_03155 [Proteobacteria bacterium]|nr:hypothetical protein [Pseudomonadota bacterium]
MPLFRRLLLLTALWPACAMAGQPLQLKNGDGPTVPAMAYGNWSGTSCPSTVVVSPGLASNERNMTALATRLEKEGYRVLVLGHGEKANPADVKLLVNTKMADDRVRNNFFKNRLAHIGAALAHARASCSPPFTALLGFSLGATAALVEAGAKANLAAQGQNRFDAYIAASPQGQGHLFGKDAWNSISKPTLVITGTRDNNQSISYKDRAAVFSGLPAGHNRLAIISGARHADVGGKGKPAVQNVLGNIVADFLAMAHTGKWLPVTYEGVDITDK